MGLRQLIGIPLAAFAAAAPLAAQDSVVVAPGTLVRVWTQPLGARWTPGPPQHVRPFLGVRGDTLLLDGLGAEAVPIPRAQLVALEARLPSRNTVLGASLGFLAAAAIGVLTAPEDPPSCDGSDVAGSGCPAFGPLMRGLAFGAGGAVVGGLAGSRVTTLKWRVVVPWQ